MEKAQTEALKQLLVDLVGTITETALRREETGLGLSAIFDLVPDQERELTIRRIESDFARMQSIRLALERINDGTYGTCLCCDREIGIKRLQKVPWAAYCATCQEAADRENRHPVDEWLAPILIKDIA
jgi:RNA polymerase-binding transcription factor DksA